MNEDYSDINIVGTGNSVSPGINYKTLSMPGLKDTKSKSSTKQIRSNLKINIGSRVSGWDPRSKKIITGNIVSLIKDDRGEVVFYEILDNNNNKIKIDAKSIELINENRILNFREWKMLLK